MALVAKPLLKDENIFHDLQLLILSVKLEEIPNVLGLILGT